MYDGGTGKPKQEFDLGELDKPRFFQAAFTADGKGIVSACGSVKIWDVNTGKVRKTLDTKELTTILVSVSPEGQRLAAYGVREEKDKIVKQEILLWDTKTGELKQTLAFQETTEWVLGQSMWIPSIAFSPDGRSLAIARMTDADVKVEGSEKTKGELHIIPIRIENAEKEKQSAGKAIEKAPSKSDRQRMQGTWALRVEKTKEAGSNIPPGFEKLSISFTGNKVVFKHEDTQEGNFTLDPSSDPRIIDFNLENEQFRGAYLLLGDELIMAWGKTADVRGSEAKLLRMPWVFKKETKEKAK